MQLKEQKNREKKNLSYLLAEQIGQRILSGEYIAGSILPGEMELTKLFDVSRTAVREAIKILIAKGMLLSRPKAGTHIMPANHWNFLDQDLLKWWITPNNINEVMAHFQRLRLIIEPQVCFYAAMNASPRQKQTMSSLIKRMYALAKRFNREKWIEADKQLHYTIYQSCGNPFLGSFVNLFQSIYQYYVEEIILSKNERLAAHKTIVGAIIDGKSQLALEESQRLLMTSE
ncbi:FadR family transcriptional regulator [Xenorhabdus sp. 42]|uniref:FadR family transcriptional regulator n=2 Tax=Xenorhabdus szentirmaii TaxID=290112 RepID=A0AAW3YU78_9GAMM|nr:MULTISPECIES: FadR/GntR family transcriptional regulator [unclassified Xenorhabdus]MBD2800571.1 FadR family transcriptional regulator [Xenorhabdus sp. M]MBD2821696.1 FadR family transcriptional regulator [Xenorhabdus sp. 42]